MVVAAIEKQEVPACTLALLDILAKYNIRRGPKSFSSTTSKQLNIPARNTSSMEKPPVSKGGKVILHLVRHGEVRKKLCDKYQETLKQF